MKRYLLPLLLAVAFLFSGLNSANATYKLTFASLTATAGPANGFSATPVPATASNYCVYGFSITGSGTTASTGTLTSLSFLENGSTTVVDNAIYTTAYLYSSTTSTWGGTAAASSTLISTETADAGYEPIFTGLNISVSNTSAAQYFFIVLSNNLCAAATGTVLFNPYNAIGYTSLTGTATPTLAGESTGIGTNVSPGPTYNFTKATACTAVVSALGVTAGPTNGLYATNPVTATGTKLPLYGIQITPSTTGSERSITALNFTAVTSPAQNNSYFFGNCYLYSCTSSTYSAGASTLVSTVAAAGTTTLNFTGINILLDANTPVYYFVLCDYNTLVAATTTWQLNYTSCTSNATVTGTANGFNYTFNALPAVTGTATSLTTTAGSNGTSSPATISAAGTYTIYGMQIVGATGSYSSKNITTLNFTTSNTNGNSYFYGTAYLFAGTATGPTGAAIATTTTTASQALSFTGFSTTQTLTAGGTLYYYVEILYSAPGVAATNTTTLSFVSDAGPTLTNGAVAGPAYTFNPVPFVTGTATSLTTVAGNNGTSSPATISTAGTYTIYGMQIAGSVSGASEGITTLNFSTSSTNGNSYFYGTAYLFAGTATGPTGAAIGTITPTTTSQTLSFTGLTGQTLTAGGTLYYYVEIVYTAPGVAANTTTTLSFVSDAGPTLTNGAVDGPAYTFQTVQTFTAANIPSTDLTPTAIYIGQTGIAVAGISMVTNTGTTTLSKLIFSYTPTAAATLGAYFTATSLKLVSTTSALASPYTGAGTSTLASYPANITATGGVITVTLPTAATINTTTTYFYLVADYTKPGGAVTQNFTFGVTGYTTAFSGAVTGLSTTNYPVNTFTCSVPTYYWTGLTGDGKWETAGNWEVGNATAPVSPALTTAYYPGYIYTVLGFTTSTLDEVDISPVVTSPTITLSTSLNIDYMGVDDGGINATLTIGSGVTLSTTTFGVNEGNLTSVSSLTLNGAGTLSGNSATYISAVGYNSSLNLNSGTINLLSGSVGLECQGTAAYPSKININGGTLNSAGQYVEATGASSGITLTGGTLNVTGTYLYFNSANDFLTNNGGAVTVTGATIFQNVATNIITQNSGTFSSTNNTITHKGPIINNGGTFTMTGVTDNVGTNGYISNTGGIFNVTNSSVVTLAGASYIKVTGGTFNLTGTSALPTSTEIIVGSSSTTSNFTNNGGTVNVTNAFINCYDGPINNTSGTFTCSGATIYLQDGTALASLTNAGTFNLNATSALDFDYIGSTLTNTGSFNVNNSAINFGLTTNTTATGCTLNNTAGSFKLGPLSTINFYAAGTGGNPSTVKNSSTGLFTCSSTSMINFANTYGIIANMSSNPFTFLSDASGSASVGAMSYTGDAMTGTYNVQRYISTASRNYRLLSSAVNKTSATPGTTTTPDVVDVSALGRTVTSPSTIPGAFIGGPGAGFSNTIANPLLYLYQESILPGTTENATFTGGKNVGIINITNASPWTVSTQSTAAGGQTTADNSTSVSIPQGNGYLLYYIHDNTSTSVTAPLDTATTTATGYINQGQIPFILWGVSPYTASLTLTTGTGSLYPGVTMVGNPYPSTIDLNKVYSDNTAASQVFTSGTGEAFYELDPSTEQFVSYNYNGTTGTTSGSTASRYVASGQGFYLTVIKANKQFYFNEDQKTATTGAAPVFPGTTLEGVRTGPATTVDNVSPVNRTTDALLITNHSNSGSVVAKLNSFRGNSATTNAVLPTSNVITDSKVAPPAPPTPPVTVIPPTQKGNVAAGDTIKTVTTVTPPASTFMGLHLKLVKDSVNFDECGLYFNAGYADKFNVNDAADLDGTGGKVYLSSYTTDRVRTSINTLGSYTVAGGKRVPLFVKFSAAGLYQLQMSDIANFKSANYSVFLLDKMLNDSLDLTLYKSYNFNYTPGTANDSTRFVLAIEHKPVPYYALLNFAGQKITQGVQLDWTVKNEFNTTKFVVQKLGANGTYAFLDSLQSDSSSLYSYVDQHPTLGNNTYRLQQTNSLGVITYSAPVTIGYNSTSPNGGLNIYPNPAKTSITVTLTTSSTATQVATADIYNTSGTLIEHKAVTSNSFTHDVSAYQLGVYIIELKNSNGVLVGKSKFVKVQ